MKKRIDRYRLIKKLQQLMLGILVVESVGAAGKGIYMAKKISLVRSGLEQYGEKEWLESEKTLQEAKSYPYFEYHEKEAVKTLSELSWITNYHESIEEIGILLRQSKENLDYELFKSTLSSYEKLNIDGLEDYQKAYYDSEFQIPKTIEEEWVQFKGYMQTMLARPVDKEKYNWAKRHIIEIPATYFSNDKTETIKSLFGKCDEQLFTKISMGGEVFKGKLKAFNEIYEINNECGYDTSWLTEKIKTYVKEMITAKEQETNNEGLQQIRSNPKTIIRNQKDGGTKESIQNFFETMETQIKAYVEVVQDYKENANLAYYDADIEESMTRYIQQKESEIQVLIEAKYYDEAISWYEALKPLGDFADKIEQIQKVKYYEDPVLLIENNLAEYSIYEVGTGAFGADKYLVALNNADSNLELYKIIRQADGYTQTKLSINLGNLGIGREDLEGLDSNGERTLKISAYDELLGVYIEKSGEIPEAKIAILKVDQDNIRCILSKTGQSISADSNLRDITVVGETGEESSGYDTYTYNGEAYDRAMLEIDEVELDHLDAASYMGQTIQFVCYIPEWNMDHLLMGYAYGGDRYYTDHGVCLQWDENSKLQAGYYKVTGEVIGETSYFAEDLNQDMVCPEVRGSHIEPVGTN